MEWQAWIGPAIVAAVISGTISLAGLYLGNWISIRHDIRRRAEKVRDFQIALRAEIRGELHSLSAVDFDAYFEIIKTRYAQSSDYSVLTSYPARHVIFESIVSEIHLLPAAVIDEIVLYSRQRYAIEKLVDDMREPQFRQLSQERQLEAYSDFIEMEKFLVDAARRSIKALDLSLGSKTPLNTRDGARSSP